MDKKKGGEAISPFLLYSYMVGFHSLAQLTSVVGVSGTNVAMKERSKAISRKKLVCELLRNAMIDIG